MSKKIVITGVGAVSSCGVGYDALKEGLAGKVAPAMVNEFASHEFGRDVPAFTVDFEPKDILGKKGLRTKDKATKMLLAMFEVAFKEWLETLSDEEKPGLMVGTGFGSIESIGNFITDAVKTGPGSVNPKLFGNTVINSPAGNANIRYGLKNLSGTMTTSFNSGLDSLIWSADHIKNGYLTSVFAAALEELSIYTLWGLDREGCLSNSGEMKPLGKDADGVVPGEGCAVVLVEDEETASARGAEILAEVVGYASGFEPNGGKLGFNPEGEVATEVIKMALANAGISADDIDVVVTDANGQVAGDAMRGKVIGGLFGDTPVVSYKGHFGETYGAGGMLDVVALLSDMEDGKLTAVNGEYDALDGVALVSGDAKDVQATYGLLTGFNVDGHCSAVVIKKR